MASVLNRTTKEYRPSANTPDFPTAQWIINSAAADALFVAGVPSFYWNIAGDVVTEMSAGEKATVDAARATAARDSTITEVDNVEALIRAVVSGVVDQLNVLRAQHALPDITLAQVRTAIRNKLGA